MKILRKLALMLTLSVLALGSIVALGDAAPLDAAYEVIEGDFYAVTSSVPTPLDAVNEVIEDNLYEDASSVAVDSGRSNLLLGGNDGADTANAVAILSYDGKSDVIGLGHSKSLIDIAANVGIPVKELSFFTAKLSTEYPDDFNLVCVDYKSGSLTLLRRLSGEATLHMEFNTSTYRKRYYDITISSPTYIEVDYIDEEGMEKTQECVFVENSDSYKFAPGGWYAVYGDVTISTRIYNDGSESDPARLILVDDSHLKAKGGISTGVGRGLKIYGHLRGTGKLIVTDVPEKSAGIGGDWGEGCGSIGIYGGEISIDGARYAAGIGSGAESQDYYKKSGSVVINRGYVNINAYEASSIGGGYQGTKLEQVIVNGGVLHLYGNIGGGTFSDVKTDVEVNGGILSVDGGIDTKGEITVAENLLFYALDENGELTRMSVADYKSKSTPYVAIGIAEGQYKARYYLQKADLTGYEETPDSPVTRSGPVRTMTAAGKRHFEGFKNGVTTEQLITADSVAELDVKYDRAWYRFNYDLNGRGSDGPDWKSIPYGAKLTEPSVKPHADGYIFDGWYEEAECINKYEFTTMPPYEVRVFAKWLPIEYAIRWMDGDRILRLDMYYFGDMPEYEDVPEKRGYRFSGWDPEVQKVSEEVSYSAVYEKLPELWHTVTFDSRGGSAVAPAEVFIGDTVNRPADPVKDAYIFEGWYTDETCSTEFDFDTPITEDLSLFAKWVPMQVQITWKDGDTTLRTDDVDFGTLPVYGEAPVKAGFAFTGWNPTVTIANSDATYTATWQRTIEGYHVVTFDAQGGSGIAAATVADGEAVAKPADPVRAGYTFEAWYLNSAGSGDAYDFSTPVTANLMLYAKWSENPAVLYTVSWKMDDGSLIDTTSVKAGEMPVHGSPAKDGYIFIGWEPDLAPVTGDITYTAQFEQRTPDKAAVMFNTDGGSFVETQVVVKGQTASRPANPVKSGYRFVGWYADAAAANEFDFDAAVTADITVYAKWEKVDGREFTITWTDWNGNLLAAVQVEEGGLPVYPNAKPRRSGYSFTGWDKDITLAYSDTTYKATYVKTSGGGGGGGGSVSAPKKTMTFSPNWYSDEYGVWRIHDNAGNVVANAWLCDDVIPENDKEVWYLLTADGAMIANGLVQDNTGNFYSLETEHNGYFGMLRYQDGTYNCNGQQVYLAFNREHKGSFGAITNPDGIEKLKAIYGVTRYGIGNENAVYTEGF